MSRRWLLSLCLLAVTGFAAWSLLTAQPLLHWMIPGGLPFGNLLTAMGLSAMAGIGVLLSHRTVWLQLASRVTLCATLLWLPVSVALAGNLTLSFSGDNGAIYWAYSGVLSMLCFLVMLAAMLVSAWQFLAARKTG